MATAKSGFNYPQNGLSYTLSAGFLIAASTSSFANVALKLFVVGPNHMYNARLSYVSADSHWTISLDTENLFNKLYWTGRDAHFDYDDNGEVVDAYGHYDLQGQPWRPRTLSLTLRYNFF